MTRPTDNWLARIPAWGYASIIFMLALICYWPAMNGDLLWDDSAHVTRPDMQSWEGLGRIWTEVLATQQYYPILHSTFWIEHRLWGNSTFGYHLAIVLQHALAACLLALVLGHLWSKPRDESDRHLPQDYTKRTVPYGAEWIAGILFVAHPVSVESVAWISEQKNTLSLVFYLLAAFVYLKYETTRRVRTYALATFLFLLALGTKTVTASLPAALLVVLWWRNGRLLWKMDVRPLLPWFLLAIAAGLSTAWIEKTYIGADGDYYALSFTHRVLLAARIVWFYLGSLAWPTDLAFFYELWDVREMAGGWIGYLAAAVLLTVGLWFLRQRSRGPLAIWLLFVGTLFPALGFFNVYPFAFSYVADHFQYHANIAIAAGAAAGVVLLFRRLHGSMRVVGAAVCSVVLIALVHLSRSESSHYIDNETLFRANVESVPDNWMARHLLGAALSSKPGREDEAMMHFQRARELNPRDPDSTYRIGAMLIDQPGREQEALDLFRRAVELRPNFAEAHYQLALKIQRDPARIAEAISHYDVAIETKPNFAEARYQLANLLIKIPERWPEGMAQYEEILRIKPDFPEAHNAYGREAAKIPAHREKAINHLSTAIALRPNYPEAHFNMASVLATYPNRMDEAIGHFEKSLQLKPNEFFVHFSLANVLAASGRFDEAIARYESTLRLRPDFAPAHAHLAKTLSSLPNRVAEAIEHYQRSLAHYPEYIEARNGLAFLLARSGRFEEARNHWEETLRLDPNNSIARENINRLNQRVTN